MEDVLSLKLLVATTGVVDALTLIGEHVLIMFYLGNLLVLQILGTIQHVIGDHVVALLVFSVLRYFVVGSDTILRICSKMSLIFFHIQT
jgi:hypothetical protein